SVNDGQATGLAAFAVNLTGVEDRAVLGGVFSGHVTEDGTLRTLGTLTIADADAGQGVFVPQTVVLGQYGAFSLAPDGAWTYQLANDTPAVQSLRQGEVVTDIFSVSSVDGTARLVTINITGANDAAVLGGSSGGMVAEDGRAVVSGSPHVSDAGGGEGSFVPQVGKGSNERAISGGIGVANKVGEDGGLAAGGAPTLVNHDANVQSLNSGQQVEDRLIVTTLGGGTASVVPSTQPAPIVQTDRNVATTVPQTQSQAVLAALAGVTAVGTAATAGNGIGFQGQAGTIAGNALGGGVTIGQVLSTSPTPTFATGNGGGNGQQGGG
ncbi:MAG TPA: hypothetical protein DCS88_14645, partial [Alphaproteobacteria bacterium]|nr:hypothetical protein [Alphaproteobacteria bacterium]